MKELRSGLRTGQQMKSKTRSRRVLHPHPCPWDHLNVASEDWFSNLEYCNIIDRKLCDWWILLELIVLLLYHFHTGVKFNQIRSNQNTWFFTFFLVSPSSYKSQMKLIWINSIRSLSQVLMRSKNLWNEKIIIKWCLKRSSFVQWFKLAFLNLDDW